jgi:Carboxypeptidase regulatory-like domain/TonB-dependent Receptor Plug Domain
VRPTAVSAAALLVLAGLSTRSLVAQSLPTATLAGKVTAEDGAGLPGIAIRLESESLQGIREISTSATGDFLVALLPAGEYTVTFQAPGMQKVSRSVTLRAAITVRVEQRMEPAAVAETVDVSAEASSTSLTSPSIEANYKKQVIDRLPVDRSLRSIALLAPGVTDNGPHGNVGTNNDRKALMISGALSYSNLFLVDGVVVNENLRGQPYDLFIEDAIEETTVSTGNISAEYGRFTGGVVNAITRSGGNDLRGSFRVTFDNDRWTANNPFDRARDLDNRTDHVTEIYEETLGGPAWKDRIWLFAAGRQAKLSDSRETRLVPRPGDADPTSTGYVHSTDERRLEGKLTASPVRGQTFVASYTDVKFDESNATLNTDFLLDTTGLVSREAPYSLLALNWNSAPTSRLFLEAQYSRRRFSSTTGGEIGSDPIRDTAIIDATRGAFASYNAPQGINHEPELYDNDSWSVKGVYFLPTSSAGVHEIHSGYERFSESARRDLHRSGSDFWITAAPGTMRGTEIFPTFRPGQTRIEWYPILEPSLGSDLVTDSGFLEDRLALGRHWSFDLGVRYDRNRDRDSRRQLVSSSGQWSPRLSFRFDPQGAGRFDVHGGYARYVDKLHDNVANAASPAGTATLIWLYQGPCVNCSPLPPASELVPANQALRILFDWFNGTGGTAGTPTVSGIVPGVSTRISPGLEPQSAREYTAGAGVALGTRGSARADFLHRDYRDLYSSRIDLSTGQSPPVFGRAHDVAVIGNSNKPARRYTAVQTQFTWRLTGSLQAAGSYTWSRLTGNVRGEGPAQSALLAPIEEYPEYKEESWSFPTGYLSGRGQTQPAVDQRHRARVWLVYRVPVRWGDLAAAILESYDSGLPYEAVGLIDPRPYVRNPGYAEPPSTVMYFFTKPGSFRTDDITRTDLAVTCGIRVFRNAELFVRPEVLNLFNEKAVVGVDTTVLTAQNSSELRRFDPFNEKPVRGVNYELSQTFGKPTGSADYQLPRTFRVSMGVRF